MIFVVHLANIFFQPCLMRETAPYEIPYNVFKNSLQRFKKNSYTVECFLSEAT